MVNFESVKEVIKVSNTSEGITFDVYHKNGLIFVNKDCSSATKGPY